MSPLLNTKRKLHKYFYTEPSCRDVEWGGGGQMAIKTESLIDPRYPHT